MHYWKDRRIERTRTARIYARLKIYHYFQCNHVHCGSPISINVSPVGLLLTRINLNAGIQETGYLSERIASSRKSLNAVGKI